MSGGGVGGDGARSDTGSTSRGRGNALASGCVRRPAEDALDCACGLYLNDPTARQPDTTPQLRAYGVGVRRRRTASPGFKGSTFGHSCLERRALGGLRVTWGWLPASRWSGPVLLVILWLSGELFARASAAIAE
jgi:hypothetical protein